MNAKPDPTGTNLSNDETLNNIFATHGVHRYTQTYPGAKTESLTNIYEVHASGQVGSLKLALEGTGKFSEIVEQPYAIIDCQNPEPPVNDYMIANSLIDNWAMDMINANCAWSITKGDSSIVVAMVDTEFDTAHQDLTGKIIAIVGGGNPVDSPCFHGTKTSGVVTARTNNNIGISSIGNKISVVGYVAPSNAYFDPVTSTWFCSGAPNTPIWTAYLDGRRIINVSWGGTGLSIGAATEMTENGTVLVLSAGNSYTALQHTTIAHIPGVITVSGATRFNQHGGTNTAHNLFVDICAPSVGVATTQRANSYGYSTGTSIAAPLVAGVAALIISINPCLTPAEVEQIILNSAEPLADQATYLDSVGAGRLDAYNAVVLAQDFTHHITTDSTWTGIRRCGADIVIDSGAKLTIVDTLLMGCINKITVMPGGKLVVDGGYISTLPYNETGFWEGIEAWGNYSQPQITTKQAFVEIKNGAVIENARKAISNYSQSDLSKSGGIIKATGSTFRNNQKSLDFMSYQNFNSLAPQQLTADRSYFTDCTFIIDSSYNGDETNNPFDCHVSLFEVDRVNFYGCKFVNIDTGASKESGEGIKAFRAGFSVLPYCDNPNSPLPCNGNLYRSTFEGFRSGVYASNDINGGYRAATIDQADFDRNSFGVFVQNQDHIAVIRNTFNVGNGKPLEVHCFDNVGIFTTNSRHFRIEENELSGVSGQAEEKVGIITENSVPFNANNNQNFYYNEIYKNTLTDLTKGCWALGSNVSTLSTTNLPFMPTGLNYVCNTFEDNDDDMFISSNSLPAGSGGILGGNGNIFVGTYGNAINNYGQQLVYYHNGGNTVPNPVSGAVILLNTGLEKTCPSKLTPDGVLLEYEPAVSIMADLPTLWSSVSSRRNYLETHIDNGYTEELIAYLDRVNAVARHDTLTSLTPWVSEKVLRTVADEDWLTGSDLMDVLILHPEVLRFPGFIDHLYEEEKISSLQRSALETEATVMTGRAEKEIALLSDQQALSEAYNILFTHIKNDSLHQDIDSIPVWLDQINELGADYELVGYHISRGDLFSAGSVLELIGERYSLGENSEYDAMIEIYNLLFAMNDEGRNIYNLTSSETTLLQGLAETFSGTQLGSTVISMYDPVNQFSVPVCFHSFSYRPAQEDNEEVIKPVASLARQGSTTTAWPNPATNQVQFDYDLVDVNGWPELIITSAIGQQILRAPLHRTKGHFVWDTRNVPAGYYIYNIRDSHGHIATGRVVIVK